LKLQLTTPLSHRDPGESDEADTAPISTKEDHEGEARPHGPPVIVQWNRSGNTMPAIPERAEQQMEQKAQICHEVQSAPQSSRRDYRPTQNCFHVPANIRRQVARPAIPQSLVSHPGLQVGDKKSQGHGRVHWQSRSIFRLAVLP